MELLQGNTEWTLPDFGLGIVALAWTSNVQYMKEKLIREEILDWIKKKKHICSENNATKRKI